MISFLGLLSNQVSKEGLLPFWRHDRSQIAVFIQCLRSHLCLLWRKNLPAVWTRRHADSVVKPAVLALPRLLLLFGRKEAVSFQGVLSIVCREAMLVHVSSKVQDKRPFLPIGWPQDTSNPLEISRDMSTLASKHTD
jgi:hypothetical protein